MRPGFTFTVYVRRDGGEVSGEQWEAKCKNNCNLEEVRALNGTESECDIYMIAPRDIE